VGRGEEAGRGALAAWAVQKKAELGLGEKEGEAQGAAGPPGKRGGGAEGVFLLFISFPFFFSF
jgi:hypothetical protein